MTLRNKRSFGSQGERLAADFLRSQGFEVLTVNYRVGRLGEIDIIARENEYICFIEVKTRKDTQFGLPSEAVDRRKQANIIRLAQVYMNQNSLNHMNARFDIVEVLVGYKDGQMTMRNINILRDAFRH